jgi:hypothetical protein
MRSTTRNPKTVSRNVAFAFALGLSLLSARRADAQPSKEDIAKADVLFRDAQILVQKGQLEEGCSKFAESQRLDPANGTLLNIAVCHEKAGKFATAYREFQELLGLISASTSRDDRERTRVANDRLKALDKKMTRAQLDVSELPKDASIMLDAAQVNDPSTPIPVDPGSHVIEVTAPKKVAAKTNFDVNAPGTMTVKIPALADDAPPPPPTPEAPPPPPPDKPSFWNGQRVLGLVIIVAGLGGVGAGAFFGLDTFAKRDARDEHCRGTLCDADGVALHNAAGQSATISTIGFAAGGAAVAIGSIVFFTASSKPKTPIEGAVSRLRLDVGPNGAGVQTGGTF